MCVFVAIFCRLCRQIFAPFLTDFSEQSPSSLCLDIPNVHLPCSSSCFLLRRPDQIVLFILMMLEMLGEMSSQCEYCVPHTQTITYRVKLHLTEAERCFRDFFLLIKQLMFFGNRIFEKTSQVRDLRYVD